MVISTPPASGPTTSAAPQLDQIAIAFARSRLSGYGCVSSDSEQGTSGDAPMPCTIWSAITVDMVGAQPVVSEAVVKSVAEDVDAARAEDVPQRTAR